MKLAKKKLWKNKANQNPAFFPVLKKRKRKKRKITKTACPPKETKRLNDFEKNTKCVEKKEREKR